MGVIFCIFGGYDVIYAEFRFLNLYNFVKSDQIATKLCTGFFLYKIKKIIIKTEVMFWSQVPFNDILTSYLTTKSSHDVFVKYFVGDNCSQ